jgi:microcin C transport system substrate-binding protein
MSRYLTNSLKSGWSVSLQSVQGASRSFVLFVTLLCFLATSCRKETTETARKLEFDAFVPVYNRYIENWLKTQQAETEKEIAKVTTDLATAEGDAKTALEAKAKALQQDQEKWNFRLGLGPYLKFSNPSEMPTDLVWENGMDQPEIGDPRAKKGGVFRRSIPEFPPTLRPFGNNSNHSFRGDLYELIDMKLITFHPETMKLIPGVAREWSSSADKRTIYFRLDPEARYSDGNPVKARDYLISAYVRVSDNLVNPYQKQYFREEIAQIAMYDDLTLSISLPEASVFGPLNAGELTPSSPVFYAEYGPDYDLRYQWRFPPTTAAYEVRPKDIIKGVSITQTRVKNWWAKDRKYYKYRFNPDKLIHTVVRDSNKDFELFRASEIDTSLVTSPELWYEKCEIPPVHEGYIERATFYRRYPRIPRGLYLNLWKKPLDNLDVRIGINHAIHWQKVIDVIFRGDAQRLNSMNEGFVGLSDPLIRARPYSIEAARAAFAKAGYTIEDSDGILKKADGTRLSIALTHRKEPSFERMCSILRQEAKACGLDLRLDGLESTVTYKKAMQKQHEMIFWGWNTDPPVPDFYQLMHSSTAFDETGKPKVDTNNFFTWARADTDSLSEMVRNATTPEDLKNAMQSLQRIIHDEAIFVPGYSVDFARIASWRWVRWPDCEDTRFSPPVTLDPHEMFVYWIDDDIKKETLAARRSGKTFPESTRVFDDYREKAPEKEEGNEP